MGMLYIQDISRQDLFERVYEISIFSCGYEERSANLCTILDRRQLGRALVFGFGGTKSELCETNETIFNQQLSSEIIEIPYGETHKLIKLLKEEVERLVTVGLEKINVLVDYSSMPRIWYSEILNFFKNFHVSIKIELDFVYSVGEHAHNDQPQQLGDPIVLPGCEAVATYNKKTVAIFGLGFDSGAPICIHGKIEPDNTYALIARPGALEDYSKKTYSINSDFITESVNELIYSPLFSVKQTYDSLREIFFPFKTSAITVIVPFGPKPHALAAIVAAMNHPGVTCLYSSTGSRPAIVTATSDLVLSRICLKDEQP